MLGLGQLRLQAVSFGDFSVYVGVDVPLEAHRSCQADPDNFVGVISLSSPGKIFRCQVVLYVVCKLNFVILVLKFS